MLSASCYWTYFFSNIHDGSHEIKIVNISNILFFIYIIYYRDFLKLNDFNTWFKCL